MAETRPSAEGTVLFPIDVFQYVGVVAPLRFSLAVQAEGPTWQPIIPAWVARRLFTAPWQQAMSWPLERFRDEQMHWQPIIELTSGPAEATVTSGMTPPLVI